MQMIDVNEKYLLTLLCCVIDDTDPPVPPEELDWLKLYHLALHHGVSAMLCHSIKRLGDEQRPPQGIMASFYLDVKKAIAKEATQHAGAEEILSAFEQNAIRSIPLKGWLLKHLYPLPYMRVMADIDFLFLSEDTQQVEQLMLDMGYTLKSNAENHDVYYRMPYMNIEMHHMLVAADSPYSDYLKNIWDKASVIPGRKYTYELPKEDVYIYLLIHIAKHYAACGIGIRSFMDIWLYHRCYHEDMDWGYVCDQLDYIGLRQFADRVWGMCEVCFGNAQSDALYDEMLDYVISSGSYGTRRQTLLYSISRKRIGKETVAWTKTRYYLGVFFPSIKIIKNFYPHVERYPFLLPFYWGIRGIKCLFIKSRHTFHVVRSIHSVPEKEIKRKANLNRKSGL